MEQGSMTMASNEHPSRPSGRIVPIPQEEWSDEAVAAMSILPPQMRPQPGQMINSLSVFAIHPDLASVDLAMSLYLRFRGTLDARVTELLILRTAWLRGAEYELMRHANKARREGWSDDEIFRITLGSTAAGWSPLEVLLLRAAEEIYQDTCVGDATWSGLVEHYSDKELLDILFTIGLYTMHAVVFNSIGLEPESDLPPFPSGT
jgi:alkylhydroperoxidase family enzyme